jgi:hypothetical protein
MWLHGGSPVFSASEFCQEVGDVLATFGDGDTVSRGREREQERGNVEKLQDVNVSNMERDGVLNACSICEDVQLGTNP